MMMIRSTTMNQQQQKQEPKKVVEIPMYDEPLLEAQQDERELRSMYERQQRWSSYPV
jgi:hypothetical protein